MRLIDADKDPCIGCLTKRFCSGYCTSRVDWYETTIDPVKHEHWQKLSEERVYGVVDMLRCTGCGNKHIYFGRTQKFCEECGAKMDEVIDGASD